MMQSYICPKTNATVNIHLDLAETKNLLDFFKYIREEFNYDDYSSSTFISHLERSVAIMTDTVNNQNNDEADPSSEIDNYRMSLDDITRELPLQPSSTPTNFSTITWDDIDDS